MDNEQIKQDFGYNGKSKQWQQGFDSLLRHLPDYVGISDIDKYDKNNVKYIAATAYQVIGALTISDIVKVSQSEKQRALDYFAKVASGETNINNDDLLPWGGK